MISCSSIICQDGSRSDIHSIAKRYLIVMYLIKEIVLNTLVFFMICVCSIISNVMIGQDGVSLFSPVSVTAALLLYSAL